MRGQNSVQAPARPHRASGPSPVLRCGPGDVGRTASVFPAQRGALHTPPRPRPPRAVLQAVGLPRQGEAEPGRGRGGTGRTGPPRGAWGTARTRGVQPGSGSGDGTAKEGLWTPHGVSVGVQIPVPERWRDQHGGSDGSGRSGVGSPVTATWCRGGASGLHFRSARRAGAPRVRSLPRGRGAPASGPALPRIGGVPVRRSLLGPGPGSHDLTADRAGRTPAALSVPEAPLSSLRAESALLPG